MGEEQWVRWEPSTTMVTVYLSVSWNVKWGQGLWDTQKSPFFPAKEAKPLAALNLCQKSTQLPQTPKHMFQRDILNVNDIFLSLPFSVVLHHPGPGHQRWLQRVLFHLHQWCHTMTVHFHQYPDHWPSLSLLQCQGPRLLVLRSDTDLKKEEKCWALHSFHSFIYPFSKYLAGTSFVLGTSVNATNMVMGKTKMTPFTVECTIF